VLRIAEQHRVAGPLRRFLDCLQNQREERVRDVGHRYQQLAGAQRPQVFRRGVRHVAKMLDREQYLLACAGGDDIRTTQDAGDGGRGDPRPFGDRVDVRHERIIASVARSGEAPIRVFGCASRIARLAFRSAKRFCESMPVEIVAVDLRDGLRVSHWVER
jgi:hypothetical protein